MWQSPFLISVPALIRTEPWSVKVLLQLALQLCSNMDVFSYTATWGGVVNGTSCPFTCNNPFKKCDFYLEWLNTIIIPQILRTSSSVNVCRSLKKFRINWATDTRSFSYFDDFFLSSQCDSSKSIFFHTSEIFFW